MVQKRHAVLVSVLMVVLAIAMLAWPSVTSQTVWIRAWSGQDIWVPLVLNDPGQPAVAGLTGQLDFDPKLFSNPRVTLGSGAAGFVAAGHLVDPGKYRFALYANPMQDLAPSQIVLVFGFHVNDTQSRGVSTQMTYSLATAGASDNASLSDVSFAPVSIVVNPNAAQEWERYN